MSEQLFLTPDEAADILRVTEAVIVDLIEEGTLAGFKIKNQWRVTTDSLTQYLSDSLRAQNLKALTKTLKDHNVWATLLNQSPELKTKIENESYEPNSMGAFLQEALAVDKGAQSGDVVLFKRPAPETEDA